MQGRKLKYGERWSIAEMKSSIPMIRRKFLLVVVFLTCVTLTDAQLFKRKGAYPDLSELKIFRIYVEGRSQTFDSDDKLEEESIDKSWVNGGPRFIIKDDGPNSFATIIGNQGTAECPVVRTGRSLLIMESPPVGSIHYLIVYNDWSKAEKGFRCVYVRHNHPIDMTSIGGKSTGSLLTVFTGVAKSLSGDEVPFADLVPDP